MERFLVQGASSLNGAELDQPLLVVLFNTGLSPQPPLLTTCRLHERHLNLSKTFENFAS